MLDKANTAQDILDAEGEKRVLLVRNSARRLLKQALKQTSSEGLRTLITIELERRNHRIVLQVIVILAMLVLVHDHIWKG